MKISILIFCLTVIFGSVSCKIYFKENVNLIEKSADNGKLDASIDFNVPLEQSLSRDKRASMPNTFPVTDILNIMGIGTNNSLIQTIVPFVEFVMNLMTGKEGLCPPIENLSFDMIKGILDKPIKTAENILCYIFSTIGKEGRAMVYRFLNTTWDFLRKIFLPGLHTTLNALLKTGLLPPPIGSMILMFNSIYMLLELLGYFK